MKDVFCQIIEGSISSNIVYEDTSIMVIMDASPFSPGHVLVIPKNHYTTILDMDNTIIGKINDVVKVMIKKMETSYPHLTGVKVVVNYGSEQNVKHYHLHLLPVYEDGNKPKMTQEEFSELLKK